MTLNLTIPQQMHTDFTPRITVIGVGGGGTNAVDNMIALDLQGVEFVVANTDAQQLMHSRANRRIQLGPHITQGLGAGAKPEIGRAAAEEAADELYRHLDGTHMVFITAGMGGGTGTGAAPVIARMARERNILTVGVVTKPFTFEGIRRARTADQGIEELQQFVDTLIVIPNQNLFRLANERTGWKEAFKMADNVLYMGVRGVTDLMVAPGLVNLDFADIRTVMAEMGKAMMGTGEADGENRAIRAAEAAISNPLLEDTSMAGAHGLLINITGGEDMTLFEVDQAANRIREEVDEEANIIFGSAIDETLNGKIRVSVVATGIDTPARVTAERPRLVAVGGTDAPANQPGAGQAASMGIVTAPPAGSAPPSIGRPSGAPTVAPVLPSRSQAGRISSGTYQPQPSPTVQVVSRAAVAVLETDPAQAYDLDGYGNAAQAATAATMAAPRPISTPDPRPRQAPLVRPAPSRTPEARPQSQSNGLFAERRSEPAGAAAPRGRSLFGKVTGAFRGGAPAGGQTEATTHGSARANGTQGRGEPAMHDGRAEPARPSVHPVAEDEETQIEIPAFLRRQSS
jgi:cell division protein FtsZ